MAKLVNPLMSQQARGKMGGLVFNTWRGLSYAKSFSPPSQPKTAAQNAIKALLTTFTRSWADLTDEQRDLWSTYAETHLSTDWTGHTVRKTAQNWYVALNVRAGLAGGTEIQEPPVVSAPDAPTGVELSHVTSPSEALKVTWTTPASADVKLFVYLQGPISAGLTPRQNKSSIKANVLSNVTHPYTLLNLPASGKYSCWVVAVDPATGLASAPVQDTLTIS